MPSAGSLVYAVFLTGTARRLCALEQKVDTLLGMFCNRATAIAQVSQSPVTPAMPIVHPITPATPVPQNPATPAFQNPILPATPVSENPIMSATPAFQNPIVPAFQNFTVSNPLVPATPVSQNPIMPVSQNPLTPATPLSQNPIMPATPVSWNPVVPATPAFQNSIVPATPETQNPVTQVVSKNLVTPATPQSQSSSSTPVVSAKKPITPAVIQPTPTRHYISSLSNDGEEDEDSLDLYWISAQDMPPEYWKSRSSCEQQIVEQGVWEVCGQQQKGVSNMHQQQVVIDLSQPSTPTAVEPLDAAEKTPGHGGQVQQPQVLRSISNQPYAIPSHHRPPCPIKESTAALPSSSIKPWNDQKTIHQVIEANHKLSKISKVSTLAVKIARDAVFGESVMRKCTAMGSRELPGLPRKELFEVKKALFDLFPSYWKSSEEFESVWATCIESIGQACKRLRLRKP